MAPPNPRAAVGRSRTSRGTLVGPGIGNIGDSDKPTIQKGRKAARGERGARVRRGRRGSLGRRGRMTMRDRNPQSNLDRRGGSKRGPREGRTPGSPRRGSSEERNPAAAPTAAPAVPVVTTVKTSGWTC